MIPHEVFSQTILQFFDPVRPYMDDPEVTDILINGPDCIYVERDGLLELTGARFHSAEDLMAAIRNAAQFSGKRLDEATPILEGYLPDGSRIEAVLPPIGKDGPHVAIRRFFVDPITLDGLVVRRAITAEGARLLKDLVSRRSNILVAGGTSSGKTSLLNALSGAIPERERVVVIEDARELKLQQAHVVSLEARPADARGTGAVPIRDLLRATLRLRPDRIVLGEVRGAEALDLVQAMTSGHRGCMATLHATQPRDTMTRLETMALMADLGMPLPALRAQIASACDAIVQVARGADGFRRVTHVTRVDAFDAAAGGYVLTDLYRAPGEGSEGTQDEDWDVPA
jgi:pilus assembly protein CpaF